MGKNIQTSQIDIYSFARDELNNETCSCVGSKGKAGDTSAVYLKHYVDNSEWSLLSVGFEKTDNRRFGDDTTTRNETNRSSTKSAQRYPTLTFIFTIRRRSYSYVLHVIVPCLMLSILTLLTFWLPCTSHEKISLGLSVFLTFSMFMLLIAEEVPATSESVPLIGEHAGYILSRLGLLSINHPRLHESFEFKNKENV